MPRARLLTLLTRVQAVNRGHLSADTCPPDANADAQVVENAASAYGIPVAPMTGVKRLLAVTAVATLLAAEARPDSFLDELRNARQKSQAREWAAASSSWERVVATNPYVGGFWYSLATAQFNAGDYRKAASSFEKALELGVGRLSIVAFDAARSHAMLKEKDATMKWLERALHLGYRSRDRIRNDETFAFLRSDARFQSLTAEIDRARMSRTEGWRHDVSFLETEIKRMHYDPFRKVPQAQFESEVQRLRTDIPRLTDDGIAVRIMRIMAMIGDGHTGLFPDLISSWKSAPLQFELFPEGLYVITADPKYADIVGREVVRIGTGTPKQVIHALSPLIAQDNRQGITRGAPRFARYPAILSGLGLQSQSESLELTVRSTNGTTRSIKVPAEEMDPEYSRIAGHPKWVTAFQMSPGPVPLYLKDRRTNYWFERLPDSKTVYFQFNLVVNSPTETLDAFLERLFRFIEEQKIEKLIIDMRWNNGGNAFLVTPLIHGLIRAERINQRGNLFLLVGRYTYSAAINAASLVESNTNAILVGEPTPTGPNFIGESNILTLPYSQLRVSISDVYHQTTFSTDGRTWLAPLLFVPPSFEAYRTKRDAALETVLAYRGNN
jgi:tetratricopeptide (TPR) repeat protein